MNEKRFKIDTTSEIGHIYINNQDGEHMSWIEVENTLNEQQATINLLLEELINAQQQGYVVGFLHKNERCNLIPKELEDE